MTIAFSRLERSTLETLRILARLATDERVIRLALQNLADHYDLTLEPEVFAYLGEPRRRRRRKRPTP